MSIVHAQPAAVPIGSTIGVSYGNTLGLGNLLSIVLSGGLVVAGIIVVFLVIGGGLKMIMSAGNSDPKGAAAGQQAVTWGVVGFLVVLSAYFIIRLIETIVGIPFITFPGF